MNGWLLRLLLGVALAGAWACAPHPPGLASAPLPAVSEALAPSLVAARGDATYVLDASGAVIRVRNDTRDAIAWIDGLEQPTSASGFAIGGDESVWYTTTGLVHAWNGAAWVTHDLTPIVGGGTYRTAAPVAVAARSIADAWTVVYDYETSTGSAASFGPVFHLCHWDGRDWSCEPLPADAMGGAWELVASPPLLQLSESYVWLLGADHVVRRRACDGTWTALASDVPVCDEQIVDDAHAFAGGCAGAMAGVAAWNGSRFARIDGEAGSFAARSGSDVWLARVEEQVDGASGSHVSEWRQVVVSRYDGTSVTEIGYVDLDTPVAVASTSRPARVQLVPTAPGAARLHVLDRRDDAGWFAATATSR
ncbi:MAG TPA: hypothetical protein VLM85_16960 [Polyangiaceae bacterium]|nr:hypothetical protein [Polyangiaceae bacterium]